MRKIRFYYDVVCPYSYMETARAARVALDPSEAVAAAYSAERFERIAEIRREAEAAGVRGVPTLVTPEGESHRRLGPRPPPRGRAARAAI